MGHGFQMNLFYETHYYLPETFCHNIPQRSPLIDWQVHAVHDFPINLKIFTSFLISILFSGQTVNRIRI